MTAVQQAFVLQYLALALKIASKILGEWVDADSDKGASAYFGLVEAAQKFDADKGTPESCIWLYVRKRVLRDLQSFTRTSKSRACKACKGKDTLCSACGGTGRQVVTLNLAGNPGRWDANSEDAEQVDSLLDRLDERSREILNQRYLGKRTQAQVAKALGISRPYVQKLEKLALASLRRAGKGSPVQ